MCFFQEMERLLDLLVKSSPSDGIPDLQVSSSDDIPPECFTIFSVFLVSSVFFSCDSCVAIVRQGKVINLKLKIHMIF